MSQLIRLEDVAKVCEKTNKLLVIYNNSVYDLTQFSYYHPGGRSVIQQYKGKQVKNIIFNDLLHNHSHSILNILEKYKFGYIKSNKLEKPTQGKNFKQSQVSPQRSSTLHFQSEKSTLQQQQNEVQGDDKIKKIGTQKVLMSSKSLNTQNSQFLTIPDPFEILKLQKQKQLRMLQEQKIKDQEGKNQQSTLLKSMTVEDFHKNFPQLKKTKKSQQIEYIKSLSNLEESKLRNSSDQGKRSSNEFYEQWKNQNQQAQFSYDQLQKNTAEFPLIQEVNIDFQNNIEREFQHIPFSESKELMTLMTKSTEKTVVQECPQLMVPFFSAKTINSIKQKIKDSFL